MRIPFTQFLMPDGRQRETSIACPADLEITARELLDAGARFECEVLNTGAVSLTVEHPAWEDEERGPVAIELTNNGPEIELAIASLIRTAHKNLNSKALAQDQEEVE